MLYSEFQRCLEQFLKGTEEVSDWIQLNNSSSSFIRSLATAIMESCIDGNGADSKLNTALLQDYSEILRRFVKDEAERELQLLFAVQRLVTQRQHPKGLIQRIFETLYDGNVVSEEGFEMWVMSEEPSEREGKADALKSIAIFLASRNDADLESDESSDE